MSSRRSLAVPTGGLCALLAAASLAACSSVESVPSPITTTAFVGVNLVPMDREIVLDDYTVLVEGERVVRVGPASEVRIPAGAVRIEGSGRYLMPGLADMHVHVWNEDHLWLLLSNGVTQVRNMWGDRMHLGWQEEIEAGTRVAPSIYTLSPLMDGPGAAWPGSTVLTTRAEARDAVVRAHAAGYPGVKVYSKLTVEVYDEIVLAADELGMRVEGHVPIAVGLEGALARGQLSSEHLTGFGDAIRAEDSPMAPSGSLSTPSDWVRASGEVALRIQAGEITFDDVYDPEKLDAVVTAVANAKMWNVPTLVVFKDLIREEALEALELPEVRYVDPATRDGWHPDRNPYTSSVGEDLLRANEIWHEHRQRLVRALHEAGAPLLIGTDCPNPFVVPGFSVHEELAHFVACGLTPFEALRAGTVDAAEFLGQSGEWGTLTSGGRADLLLLEANPLDDVANAQLRVGVMVRGRWLPERDLLAGLEQLAAKYEGQQDFYATIASGDIDGAWELRSRWVRENGTELVSEQGINSAAYSLLAEERFGEAIDLFTRNAQAYPLSGNTWDSLAEAFMLAGHPQKAIEHYEHSLAVDPSNANADAKLRELRGGD